MTSKSPSKRTTQLLETVLSESLTSENIDREAGVIRGVKVLGRVSKNGREYSDAAMDDGVRLYEGLKVNVDHPDRKNPKADRGFLEGFGELRNLKKTPSGVYGDLHFLKSHSAAETVCEAAERFPKQFGLSHNAEGEVAKRGGKWIVESLKSAASVDIVGRPATNDGLFESIESPEVKPMKTITASVRSLIESAKNLTRYKLAHLLEMEGGDAAMLGTPMDIEVADEEDAADTDGDGQIDEAFKAMIVAVLDDTEKDVAAKLARIKEILQAQDKLMNGKVAEETSTETEEETVAESTLAKSIEGLTKLVESTQKMQAEQSAKLTLIESKREVKPERVKALVEAKDADHATLLLESWPVIVEKGPVIKPRSGSTLLESQNNDKPLRGKDFITALKRA
jgi:hypothetical protein